ncbi:hypothetical protein [Bacillus sp. FJAT-18017]|uniref:hypothetical protein n=1 Tax=Bacillus sp. FJAT-18017 TaxID=1705566 RepID=UPI0006B051CD|nr:hypothetical protein [Bacillus sp. FJAT-18017]
MWLLVISAILFPLLVFFMPKRIPLMDLYATTGMATYFQLLTDVYLHIKLDWYGYFSDNQKAEWPTTLLTPLYLSINPLFLNFYPYDRSKFIKILYMGVWTVFSVLYEWIATKTGMFYHEEWKLYHSALTYPFLFILLRLQLSLVRHLRKREEPGCS